MSSKTVSASPTGDPYEWVQQALFAAFGQGTPIEQMVYAGIFFVLVFSWTAIGLVFTVFLDLIFAVLFLIGLARLIIGMIRGR